MSPRELVELRDGHAPARLLIVDDRVPHVDRGGGDPRMHRMLMELLALWPLVRVTLFASMPDNGSLYARPLRQAGIEVVFGESLDAWLALRRGSFDVILISRPRPVLDTIRTTQPQARIVYDMEALHFRRYQRMLRVASPDDARGLANAASDLLALETKLVAASDVVIAVSEDDRSFARIVAPATPSFVVSHASEAPPSVPSFEARRDMIFFGAFWNPGSPNEDAVLRLARHVMPLVWAEDPSIRLVIVGADPTPAVQRLDGGNITVRGYISNPIEVLTRARVHVVPIRMGAGVKLRLIDSMAAGLPFVTTTIGAEGLPLGPLTDTIVADAPADLARRALALYHDSRLWTNVQEAIRGLAVAHFSAAVLRRQLADALAPVGFLPPHDGDVRRPTTVKSGVIPVAHRCE
jgi:glycosyltransferase involved in cell wall biosynthesis